MLTFNKCKFAETINTQHRIGKYRSTPESAPRLTMMVSMRRLARVA